MHFWCLKTSTVSQNIWLETSAWKGGIWQKCHIYIAITCEQLLKTNIKSHGREPVQGENKHNHSSRGPFTARAEPTVIVIWILWWNFNYSNRERMMMPIIFLLIAHIYLLTLPIFQEVSIHIVLMTSLILSWKKVCIIQQDNFSHVNMYLLFFFPISYWRKIFCSVLLMSFRYWLLWTVAFISSLFKL